MILSIFCDIDMKICNYCHVEKNLIEFPLKKDGTYSGNCLACKAKRKQKRDDDPKNKEKRQQYYQENKEIILENRKEYYQENKEEIDRKNKENYESHKTEYLEYKKEYYQENKEHYSELDKQNRINNPIKYLLKAAKKRSKEDNLPFDLSEDDIVIPQVCPILKIEIKIGNSIKDRDSSPSLDKVIPELGYVKGNVKVISFKANSLKRDGHIEDFENIIKYIKENANR